MILPTRCVLCDGPMGEVFTAGCWSCLSAECQAFGRHQTYERDLRTPGPHGFFGSDLVIAEVEPALCFIEGADGVVWRLPILN